MLKSSIALLGTLFLFASCTNEYFQYHEQKRLIGEKKQELRQTLEEFSVGKIESRDLEILTTPNKKVLDRIVSMIEESKERVFVEVYIFTEKRILQALKDAKNRGVDVRVVLEKNVYGATSINAKTFKELQNAGISVTYDNSKLYNFVHTKLLLIDDVFLITTGNLSYASFTTNREFYVIGRDRENLRILENIFLADFAGQEISETTDTLVISPIDSRKKIETLLESAEKDIFLYAQNFGDTRIEEILANKVANGIPVTICMADSEKVKSNADAVTLLRSRGIDARTSKKPAIHAKSALVDGTYGYIGSENYSTNSLDENREIGILMRVSPEFTELFHTAFRSDCPKEEK